ncbi:four helix bundle protein, partial [Candidatus Curtissbacteria bacterium RIFCSPLOWO2_01_FULL_37_9]
MGDFRKLEIWQRAHKLTLEVYKLSKKLPKEELYGLTSQVTRAAVSVESNIAEGESRYTDPAKIRFFIDARASVSEVIVQLT